MTGRHHQEHNHSHDHRHDHSHGHGPGHHHASVSEGKLVLTIILNIIITISEIAGGLLSGSLALLSDAFHNFSDVFSLIISFIAIRIAKKEKDSSRTFGYKRAEILAALLNVILLLAACGYIVYEAVKRFFHPQEIHAPLMLIVTIIGLAGNAFSILLLISDSKKSLNIKSSFLHLLGDTISSVGVLIAALILYFVPGLSFIDPVISVLIALYIIKESFSIFMESINILMQGIPKGVNIENIIKRLREDKSLNLIDIHHVHLWCLAPEEIIFDCHVVLQDHDLQIINRKLEEINHILSCEFQIHHSTIQFETEGFDHSTKCKI